MPRLLSELETTRGKQVPKRRELLVRCIIPWRSFNLERERITQIQNEKYKSGRWCLPRYTIFLFTLCWGQWFNLRWEATKSSVRAYLMSWILVHISACEWGRKRLNPSPVVFLWAYYYSSEKWKGLFCLAFCSSLLLPFITWGLSFFLPCQGQFIWNYLFWWEGRDWHEPFLISLTCKDWWIENQSSFRDTCISSTALHVKILLV